MEEWLAGLIASVPGPLRPAANIIVGAILRVFQWVDGLFRRVVGGWNPLYGATEWLGGGLKELRDEIVETVKWVILTKIPQWSNAATQWAVRWAADRLRELRDWTAGQIQAVLRWAADRIGEARDLVDRLTRWASDQIHTIVDRVNRLLGRVFDDWATPLRLAEWLIGPLWTVFWRYAYSQRDKIIDWVWSGITPRLLRFAAEIERQIARVL